MLSPRIKRTITRILPFGIIWLLTGWVFLFIETSALNNVEQTSNTAIQVDYRVFIFASLAVLIVGFLVGLLELLLFRRLFYNYSFFFFFFLKNNFIRVGDYHFRWIIYGNIFTFFHKVHCNCKTEHSIYNK